MRSTLLLLLLLPPGPGAQDAAPAAPALAKLHTDSAPPGRPRFAVYLYTCVFDAFAGSYDQLAQELVELDVARVRLSTKPQSFASDAAYVQRVKDLNRALHARGIEVVALYLQDASALDDPAKVRARTNLMVDFDQGAFGGILAGEPFDGLDLDVEPSQHALWGIDWPTNSVLVQKLVDDVVAEARRVLDRRLGAAASAYPLSVGVPHWYHDRVLSGDLTVGTPTDFLTAGASVVSLFDYDDDVADLVSRAALEVMTTQVPQSIELVFKTVDDGQDGQTFYEEGCAALRAAAYQTVQALHPLAQYDSLISDVVAVFELDSLRELCLGVAPVCP